MLSQILHIEDAFTALQNGDEKGLNYFFNRFYPPLAYYSTSITNDESAAQDIVLEAFLKLWRLRTEINAATGVRFMLYRLVRNASIDYIRSQKREKQATAGLSSYTTSYETDSLTTLTETETYHRLHVLISNLPEKCRQVFYMFYFEDKSIKQIAGELNISVNTVKSQKQRALQLLKENQSLLFSLILFIAACFIK